MLLSDNSEALNREVNKLLLPSFRLDKKIFCSSLAEWGAALGCITSIRERLFKTIEKNMKTEIKNEKC